MSKSNAVKSYMRLHPKPDSLTPKSVKKQADLLAELVEFLARRDAEMHYAQWLEGKGPLKEKA